MDILFSLLLLLILFLPILSKSDRLLKLLFIFLCFMKTESHSNLRILFVQGQHPGTDFPFGGIVHSVSSYPVIIFLYFDSGSYENIANFSLSFVQELSFLYSSLLSLLYRRAGGAGLTTLTLVGPKICHLWSKHCIFRVLVGPIIVRLRFFSNGRTNLALLTPLLYLYHTVILLYFLNKNLCWHHWWHHVVDLHQFANDEGQGKKCIVGYN